MADDKLLIEEICDINENFDYKLIKEEVDGKKKYFIRGAFSKAGVVNKNKRYYPMSVMTESINESQTAIKASKMVGELEHPNSPKINLDRIAIKINEMSLAKDGTVFGEMEVIDTPCGKTLQTLIDSGIGLGVSTRGTGSVKKTRHEVREGIFEDVLEVQPNFKLRAIDIVFDPSAGEFGSPQFMAEGLDWDNEGSGSKTTFGDVWTDLFN